MSIPTWTSACTLDPMPSRSLSGACPSWRLRADAWWRSSGYLLDSGALGGIGGELYAQKVCGGSFGGTTATVHKIYVPCTDGLVALPVSEDTRSFTSLWRSGNFDAGPPIVAGGLVWTVDLSVGALVGLDEANGVTVEQVERGEPFGDTASASLRRLHGRPNDSALARTNSNLSRSRCQFRWKPTSSVE